jgi:hypothetical protein
VGVDAVRAESGASRSSSVDRGIEGKEVGEEAWCTDTGEENGRNEGRHRAVPFYGGSVVRAGRKRAGGPARCHVGTGEGVEGAGSGLVACGGRGRGGGGSGQGMVRQEEWGSGWRETREHDGGSILSVRQGTAVCRPTGRSGGEEYAAAAVGSTHKNSNLFDLFKGNPKRSDLIRLKDGLSELKFFK